MKREQLDAPPLSAELLSIWSAYLDAWSAGMRPAAMSLLQSLDEAIDELEPFDLFEFSSWLCERLFDDSEGWRGQFGGGLLYRDGKYERPIDFALSIHPLTSNVVIPHVVRESQERPDGSNLRWLWQSLVGLSFRVTPDLRSQLEGALRSVCGPSAKPVDALRRASVDDARARRWISDMEPEYRSV